MTDKVTERQKGMAQKLPCQYEKYSIGSPKICANGNALYCIAFPSAQLANSILELPSNFCQKRPNSIFAGQKHLTSGRNWPVKNRLLGRVRPLSCISTIDVNYFLQIAAAHTRIVFEYSILYSPSLDLKPDIIPTLHYKIYQEFIL